MKRLLIFATFLLSGCALYKKPVIPPVKTPAEFKYSIKVQPHNLKYQWWENFNDCELNELVHLAIVNNYSYEVALKNIDIAKTYVTQNQSLLFPLVNLNFATSRNRSLSLYNTNTFISNANTSIVTNTGQGLAGFGRVFSLNQLFGSVNYEIDAWNQIRNSVKQAKANVGLYSKNADVAKLTLVSNVVNTYFEIQAINSNLNNLNEQKKIAIELLHYNTAQYGGKLINTTTLEDANNQIANININLENLKKQKAIYINTLAYLEGMLPEEFKFNNNKSLPSLNFRRLVPEQLPAKMVANRPDLQAAYFQALTYGYFEKQNLANFFPPMNLTGNYGYAGSNYSHLFIPNNIFWNYGFNLIQTVFSYKYISSQYKRSKEQFASSILNFKNTIVTAYKEVNNALVSYQKDYDVLHHLQKEMEHAKNKANVTHAQYQSGYGNYINYLNDKLNQLQIRYNFTNQQLLVTKDVIQIYKTLGLGVCADAKPVRFG